jgi:hypothetical protein
VSHLDFRASVANNAYVYSIDPRVVYSTYVRYMEHWTVKAAIGLLRSHP